MRKKINQFAILLVTLTLGGALLVFVSFGLLGFPVAKQPHPTLRWWKLTGLLLVLGYPFATGTKTKSKGEKMRA